MDLADYKRRMSFTVITVPKGSPKPTATAVLMSTDLENNLDVYFDVPYAYSWLKA